MQDLENSRKEVIIESPFITAQRTKLMIPTLKKLLDGGVKIYVFTRDPKEHYFGMEFQSEIAIQIFESIGVQTLLCKGNHHRKLAILDRKILWEGSLNILSQTKSREIMRRIEGREAAVKMFDFLEFKKFT